MKNGEGMFEMSAFVNGKDVLVQTKYSRKFAYFRYVFVIHRPYGKTSGWVVSEKESGLKVFSNPQRTINLAIDEAVRVLEYFGIEKVSKAVENGKRRKEEIEEEENE